MEQLDLTTPTAGPSIVSYKVLRITFGTSPPIIDWTVADNTGASYSGTYSGEQAATMLSALNTANLTTNSLQKRILTQLQADGSLPSGSISGTPQ